jgi:SAM-dependent methyltransferase
VLEQIVTMLRKIPNPDLALDYGAGDGWFSREIARSGLARKVVAVDVLVWPGLINKPVLFDGSRLPFADGTFDVTYAIDVLHHCPDPGRALGEILRCTRRYFLIKDHTYRHGFDWLGLALMDELGNRRFGVPSPHRYQQHWKWNAHFEMNGFFLESLIHPALCHFGLLGRLTNHLQFLALWKRRQSLESTC